MCSTTWIGKQLFSGQVSIRKAPSREPRSRRTDALTIRKTIKHDDYQNGVQAKETTVIKTPLVRWQREPWWSEKRQLFERWKPSVRDVRIRAKRRELVMSVHA